MDLGSLGELVNPSGPQNQWHDHGLGLLRTILHQNGLATDLASVRRCRTWYGVGRNLRGYDVLLMNVRSHTFPMARRVARLFKQVNPGGLVLVGGMHALVAPDEMESVAEFDRICRGPGEKVIVDLVTDPRAFPRIVEGTAPRAMADWPVIDRTLWPRSARWKELRDRFRWPLEPACGWGPPPVATILTSRVCPWRCVFCNESSYLPSMTRRPVDMVIDELNFLDRSYGVGSVVIHDSMFFQNPAWLEEWLEKYPRKARKLWPYWAAARADTVRQWPELFEALVRETHWNTVSIGFESGSDRVLRILNKECTEEDNYFAIDLLTRIGDDLEAQGRIPPVFWSNIMLGIPGERREDAFKTMRMVRYTKRLLPSIAFYAPYPGSALGYQLIAEGKSLMTPDSYHRYASDEKVKGIDYRFYRDLLGGIYDEEVNGGLAELRRRREIQLVRVEEPAAVHGPKRPGSLFTFGLKNGKRRLAYGETPEDALEILGYRMNADEMSEIVRDDVVRMSQHKLRDCVHLLG